MRLLEITISVYPKEASELIGENNRSMDVERRCVIDLDRVESFWEYPVKDGGDGLLIKPYSNDSYWTKSFTLDRFVKIINQSKFEALPFSDLIDQSRFHVVCHG